MKTSSSYKKRESNFLKSSSKSAEKVAPVVKDSLKTAGVVAKDVAKETIPIVEKGVSAVYGTLASGFNLGVTGAKNVAKGVNKLSKKTRRNTKKSKRRSLKHRVSKRHIS